MSFVAAEILQSVIGNQPVNLRGFDIHSTVKQGADITADTRTVDVELKQETVAAAHARNEGGANKALAAAHPAQAKPGSAMSFLNQQHERGDSIYGGMFKKHGLQSSVDRALSQGPQPAARRRDHRGVLMGSTAFSPLQRENTRQMLKLRKTFNEVAAQKKRQAGFNPEMLPQADKDRMTEEAVAKGEQTTPFGRVEDVLAHKPSKLGMIVDAIGHSGIIAPAAQPVVQAGSKSLKEAMNKFSHLLAPGSVMGEMVMRRN